MPIDCRNFYISERKREHRNKSMPVQTVQNSQEAKQYKTLKREHRLQFEQTPYCKQGL
jgi:hypothetical protein